MIGIFLSPIFSPSCPLDPCHHVVSIAFSGRSEVYDDVLLPRIPTAAEYVFPIQIPLPPFFGDLFTSRPQGDLPLSSFVPLRRRQSFWRFCIQSPPARHMLVLSCPSCFPRPCSALDPASSSVTKLQVLLWISSVPLIPSKATCLNNLKQNPALYCQADHPFNCLDCLL